MSLIKDSSRYLTATCFLMTVKSKGKRFRHVYYDTCQVLEKTNTYLQDVVTMLTVSGLRLQMVWEHELATFR